MNDPAMKETYVVGVDVGGTHLRSAVFDVTNGTLCTPPLTTPVDSHAGALEIVSMWVSNVRSTIDAFDARVRCVGLAFPGPFDYNRGVSLIEGVAKYESVYGLNVKESMRSMLPSRISEMRFVNDASAFALGEALYGVAKGDDRVIALTLGTGVGSGFVDGGKLVTDSPDVPANGWVYCLPFEDGIVDDAFSTRWIVRRYSELTGEAVSGAKEVADRYSTDAAAKQVFAEYGFRLGDFLAPLLERFRCGSVVLGGNISRAFPLFSPSLEKSIADKGLYARIRVSSLIDNAAVIGAASLFL